MSLLYSISPKTKERISERIMTTKQNNRAKGNRNLLKTKKLLESEGWVVARSETIKMAFFKGKMWPIREDVWGSDLMCINGKEIMFVQVKSRKDDIPEATREMNKYPYPASVRREVWAWEDRARKPIKKVISKLNP